MSGSGIGTGSGSGLVAGWRPRRRWVFTRLALETEPWRALADFAEWAGLPALLMKA